MSKILHYCWFGNSPLPESALYCMESWKKFCPDFEIKRWDETNFDVQSVPFTAEAYQAKKYAFVSDYVRTYALYKEGGLYLDTDVELVKSIDDLLDCSFIGFESVGIVNPGLILYSNQKESSILKSILDIYQELSFKSSEASQFTVPLIYTRVLKDLGLKEENRLQTVGDMKVYPIEFFNPKGTSWKNNDYFTSNTRSIHHFEASWLSQSDRQLFYLSKTYGNFWGKIIFSVQHPIQAGKKLMGKKNVR